MSGGSQAVLLLGGTGEARALAAALAPYAAYRTITSLAGRTAAPRLPDGETRIGGFGGAAGLAAYLRAQVIAAVIDATHPFAATMGRHAAEACAAAGVPLLRLERPPWTPQAADRWTPVADSAGAAAAVAAMAHRVLLAVGRQELAAFAALDDIWFLIRAVERPDPLPAFRHAELLLARGPFSEAGERELLARQRIDTVVCKNSGGTASAAKLAAARALGLNVVMIARPLRPSLPTVHSVGCAVRWLQHPAG